MDLARCLFVSGRSFVTGAYMIVKSNHRRQYRTDSLVIFPTAMLVAHAVEVYLQARLAQSDAGYTERVLKFDFGHDLRRLYAEAIGQGMVEPDDRVGHRFLDLIETYEKEHGDYSFRYFHEGLAFAVPKNDACSRSSPGSTRRWRASSEIWGCTRSIGQSDLTRISARANEKGDVFAFHP